MNPPSTLAPDPSVVTLPDHMQLPEKDGTFVRNFQEPPQSTLLSGSLFPRLVVLYGYGRFCIGCDSGIYWRYTQPVLDGCKAPDWFLVPGVPAMLEGQFRRSYVLWQEAVRPLLVIEYVSGDGSEERDTTLTKGSSGSTSRPSRPRTTPSSSPPRQPSNCIASRMAATSGCLPTPPV